MRIDLKDPASLTFENVRILLASKDDSENRQLRISDAGEAYLSDDVGNLNLQGVKTQFETWIAGNDYCGANAAADEQYVEEIFNDLRVAWDRRLTGLIDCDPREA
jgi:hypothetical protein